MTVRDLETIRQEYKESFAEFLTRWREKAAKIINRSNEKEQVCMIIKNMQPKNLKKLEFQSISTFEQLFDIGTRIEDAIRDGKIKRENQANKYMGLGSDVNTLAQSPQHKGHYQKGNQLRSN